MPPVKVKFVEYGEQARVKIVNYGEDMQVIPVEYGEQMRVKIVEYGEDFKVKIVQQDTSLCLITTACVEAKGLPDNCLELNTMRAFRDSYIKSLPDGEEIIREYYQVAPQIVARINRTDNWQEVYLNLYEQLVLIVELICRGENDEALRNCLRIFNELKQRYL
jgi:hypothetical protein